MMKRALTYSMLVGGILLGPVSDSLAGEVEVRDVQSGLAGAWKVGFTTCHSVLLRSDSDRKVLLQLDTVDGDGVGVRYSSKDWEVELRGGVEQRVQLHAKHGRANRPIQVILIDAESNLPLVQHELSAEERGQVLPAEQPWVVGIGSKGMKLDSAVLQSSKNTLGDYYVTELHDASMVPTYARGFDGVDLLIFSSSNTPLIQGLSQQQSRSISEWIVRGGRCVLTLGAGTKEWFQQPAFAKLVPGTFVEVASRCSPGPLESYLNSELPLKPIDSAVFQVTGSEAELLGQKQDRGRYPLLAKWTVGLGKVRLLATEIDSPSIQDWESQTALIKSLLHEQWEGRGANSKAVVGAEDISIQLNGALDRFENLKVGNLTLLSMIMVVLLAILGPLDYFIVAKRWKLPRGTWVTLVVVGIGCCSLLVYLQRTWKPPSPQINTMEIVDIAVDTHEVVGHAMAHLYGGSRGEFDVASAATPGSVVRSLSGIPAGSANDSILQLDWMGHPGKSLGGFDSSVASDRVLPKYEIQLAAISGSSDRDTSNITTDASGLHALGVPEAGTKGMECYWHAEFPSETQFGSLRSIPGAIELLSGKVINPLNTELLNSVLLYRGRFYTLPLKLRGGEEAEVSVGVVPKDFARRMQRRIIVDGKDQGSPWDRSDTTDLKRLLEMLAFHRSSGAFSYTGQIHRYLSKLDQSEALKTERAILFAELAAPQVQWSVSRNHEPLNELPGHRTSLVRIFLPVQVAESTPSSQ